MGKYKYTNLYYHLYYLNNRSLPLPSWDEEIVPFGLLLLNPGGPRIKQIPMIIKRIRIVPQRHAIRTIITVGAIC